MAATMRFSMRHLIGYFILFSATTVFAEDYGGLNMARYCTDTYPGSRAAIVDATGKETREAKGPQRAYGWRCIEARGKQHDIPVGQLCVQSYGANAAPVADVNDAYSWKCVKKGDLPELAPVEIPGQTVLYTSYGKSVANLNIYRGERMAILSPYKLPEADVPQIIRQADTCASVYADLSVRNWPYNSTPGLSGMASIGLVDKTCGAGCGAGGRAEIQVDEFRDAFKRTGNLKSAFTWQVGFYEFGRSGSSHQHPAYPFYAVLDPSKGHDFIASAFPEFAMSVCYDRLGITPAVYQNSYKSIGYPRNQHVTEHARQYWDSTLSFTEALSKDRKGYYRGWMLSGLLFDVYREFGYDTARQFMRQLAELAAKEGQVKSIAGVGQNILKAAQATGVDRLADYLRQKWRMQN
jgi:hypothetical protein